jgi:DNA repair exonuclease SbcCD nuclease subunit
MYSKGNPMNKPFAAIAFADLHLQGGPDTPEAKFLDSVTDYVKDHDEIRFVFVPGDIYEAASTPEQRLIWANFVNLMADYQVKIIILRGNHDQPLDLMAQCDVSRGIYVSEMPEVITVEYHEDQPMDGPGLQILTIPHFNAGAVALMSESLRELNRTATNLFDEILIDYANRVRSHAGPSLLLFHAVVDGAHLDNGMIPRTNGIHLNAGLLNLIPTLCIGGHYHAQQLIKGTQNSYYTGSGTQQTFGETDQKGFLRLQYNGNAWEEPAFIPVETTPRILVEATWNCGRFEYKHPGPDDAFIFPHWPQQFSDAMVRFRFSYPQEEAALLDFTEPERLFAEAKAWVKDPKPIIKSTARCEEIGRTESVEESLRMFLELHGKAAMVDDVLEAFRNLDGNATTPAQVAQEQTKLSLGV